MDEGYHCSLCETNEVIYYICTPNYIWKYWTTAFGIGHIFLVNEMASFSRDLCHGGYYLLRHNWSNSDWSPEFVDLFVIHTGTGKSKTHISDVQIWHPHCCVIQHIPYTLMNWFGFWEWKIKFYETHFCGWLNIIDEFYTSAEVICAVGMESLFQWNIFLLWMMKHSFYMKSSPHKV